MVCVRYPCPHIAVEKLSMKPVTVALVGCGSISVAHGRAMAHHGAAVEVSAVCDSNEGAAGRRARQLRTAVRSWDEILNDPAIAAVDLCVPHGLHKTLAVEALEAGKHVLVEKPVATTLEDADAMIGAAERAGRILMVAQSQRFEPQHQLIHRQIESGAIGPITMARADHQQNLWLPADHWLCDPAQAGGGVILGSGIHRLDLLRWYCGEISEVYCVHRPVSGRLDGRMEVNALVMCRHATGAISECAFNWAAYNSPWFEMLILYGQTGQLHNIGGVQVARSLSPGPHRFERLKLPSGPSTGFDGEILHFAESIRTGTTPLTDAKDNRRTLAAVLACYESARTSRPITL